MPELKTPLEIYKLLPKTNCGQCRLPTCLAFAAAVIKGEKQLGECPHLEEKVVSQYVKNINTRAPFDQNRAEKLSKLREKVSKLDFQSSAKKIGARLVNNDLIIACLGKKFRIDKKGNVTSSCHTHAGLTIPLLSYILFSKGDDIIGKWIPFRELKNGAPMSPLFTQRGENPLKELADKHTDLFEDLISIFSGQRAESFFSSDISLTLYPLPKLPILICYWRPEDDLDSKLNIFFDETACSHLPVESIFELGVGLVMMFEKVARQHS